MSLDGIIAILGYFFSFSSMYVFTVAAASCVSYSLLKLAPPFRTSLKHWRGKCVGHRGCRIKGIPENTMASIKHATQQGVFGLEIDVRMTKDGEIIVFHDQKVDRMLQGNGSVSDYTLSEIHAMPLRGYPESVQGHAVPELAEVLEFCRANSLKLLIEIKQLHSTIGVVKKVEELIRKHDMIENCLIISFSPIPLYQIRAIDPEIHTCILWEDFHITHSIKRGSLPRALSPFSYLLDWMLLYCSRSVFPHLLGVSMVGPDQQHLSKTLITRYQKDFEIYTWTVNDNSFKDYLNRCGVVTATDFCFPGKTDDTTVSG
eukprot:213204_1